MRSAPDGTPKETFACNECGQSYSRLEYLRRHQRKHDDVRPFACDICPKKFARSDVLLRHKRRCHEDAEADATADVDDAPRARATANRSRAQDGPTALALAAAAVAQMESAGFGLGAGEEDDGAGSGSSRRRRPSTRGRGGKRAVEHRSPSEEDGSRSPDRDRDRHRAPPSKVRRLETWDLMSGQAGPSGIDRAHLGETTSSPEDEYARAVGVAAREYVAGVAGGYNIDPRLSAADLASGSGSGYAHTSSRGSTDYSRYPAEGYRDGGYSVPGYGEYDRSASHSGSSGDQYRGPIDEYGRPLGYATTADRLGRAHGQDYEVASPTSMYFPQGLTGYGSASYRARGSGDFEPSVQDHRRPSEYDAIDAQGRRSSSSGRASGQSMSEATAAAAAANATSHALAAKRNSSVNMEDATTLLAMAYGGFGQWSGGNVDPALGGSGSGAQGSYAGGSSNSPATAPQATVPGGQSLANHVHRASIASAGEVAGHTVVPDWDPRPQTAGGNTQNSSGWTGGRLDGLGPDSAPFQSEDAANTSARTSLSKGMSMSNLIDPNVAAAAGTEVSPSLYNGNWAAAPAVTTPGPFAGIDFARMSQAITDGWGNYDMVQSPGMPSRVNSPLQFNSVFNMFGIEDDGTNAAEVDGQSLCHLPGSTPQLTNLNPERPLLRIQSENIYRKMGAVGASDGDRYSLPPDRFQSCYTIPHWRMPPMPVLKRIARKTVSGLLTHLSLVHLPTFHMRDVPVGLAFAICVVGSPRRSSIAREYLFAEVGGPNKELDQAERQMWFAGSGVLRPDPPGCDPCCLIEEIGETPEERDFEERKKMVAVEKSSMIAQILSRQKNRDLQLQHCAHLQALVLFASPLLLAPQISNRLEGYARLRVIISAARQHHLIDESGPHFETYTAVVHTDTHQSFVDGLTDAAWRDWIQQETVRRLAWTLYMFDTLSMLESGSPCQITPAELSSMPLPAPDSLWKAQSPAEWNQALMAYKPATLEECMQDHFKVENWGAGGAPIIEPPSVSPDVTCLVNRTDFGMFARYMMVLTLTRGLVDLGQGKRNTGDWQSVTDLWSNHSLTRSAICLGGPLSPLTVAELVGLYGVALSRWRQGWDFDPLCDAPAVEALKYQALAKKDAEEKAAAEQGTPDLLGGQKDKEAKLSTATRTDSTAAGSETVVKTPEADEDHVIQIMNKPKKGIFFYEEALPFYWLSQALHSILAADTAIQSISRDASGNMPDPDQHRAAASVNRFSGIDLAKMLQSARVFTRLGEGVAETAQ